MHTSKMVFSTAAAIAALSLAASAAVIAVDDFSYPDGNLAGNNGGSGWGAAWTTLPGPQATVASGAATFTFASTGAYVGSENSRALSAAIGAGTTTWIRFDGGMSTSPSVSDSFGGISLYAGTQERALIGKDWPGNDIWAIKGYNSANVTTKYDSTIPLTGGMADVWVKIVNGAGANDDTMSLWVNPADFSSEAALGTALGTLSGRDLNFDTIRLRGGSATSGHTATWTYDDLKITNDFASMIPEPSSALLGGLGLLALLRRRRA
jgi:hypothetical protein